MITAAQHYEIDAEQIEAIVRNVQAGEHRYVLEVVTKSGQKYAACYKSEAAREIEIKKILERINREKEKNFMTVDLVRYAVSVEIDKLRPYLRRMEKNLKENCKEFQDESNA